MVARSRRNVRADVDAVWCGYGSRQLTRTGREGAGREYLARRHATARRPTSRTCLSATRCLLSAGRIQLGTRRMKICMMTNTYLPHVGGVARSVSTFAEEFQREGHEVLVVAPEFDGKPLAAKAEAI